MNILSSVISVILGVLGFALMAAADWAGYKKYRRLKPALWLAMMPVSTAALIMAWTNSDHFGPPTSVVVIAWVLFFIFVILFLYSLYIEIPLRAAYVRAEHPASVVTEGTYALCRHPAFLWYTGWMVCLIFISGAVTLAVAVPIWVLAYIGGLFVEEEMCCREAFAAEYRQYQQNTPMLLPTTSSIRHFLATFRPIKQRYQE